MTTKLINYNKAVLKDIPISPFEDIIPIRVQVPRRWDKPDLAVRPRDDERGRNPRRRKTQGNVDLAREPPFVPSSGIIRASADQERERAPRETLQPRSHHGETL